MRGDHGQLRFRQIHPDASARLPGPGQRGRVPLRRPGRQRHGPPGTGLAAPGNVRLRVPELSPDRHRQRLGKRGVAGDLRRYAPRRAQSPRPGTAHRSGSGRAPRPSAQPVVRRSAATGVHRPGIDERRPRDPRRRAHRRPRQPERRGGDGPPHRARRPGPHGDPDHPRSGSGRPRGPHHRAARRQHRCRHPPSAGPRHRRDPHRPGAAGGVRPAGAR